MKKILLGSTAALALLAFPVTANPIIKVHEAGKSSFHPAKMHVALSGLGHGYGIGKHPGNLGFCGLSPETGVETGSAKEDFTPPTPHSGYKLADLRIPECIPDKPHPGPGSNAQPIPEPSTLALFGIFSMVLALRSRWATWHR